MCGFVVLINPELSKDKIFSTFNKLKKLNTHRGPDDVKILHKAKYSILFRRLEVIDLHKRSAQPFCSDDGKVTLVFNGEIYNYLQIKNQLKKINIKFKTESDTEVILKSYLYWGIDFVKRLRGMFSIIIFDENKKKFFCLRDRLGQKPLFYSRYKNGLIISSEIKDILFFKKNNIHENENTVFKYLFRGWCDDENETFFKDIHSFPSRSIGLIGKNSIKIEKYWNLDIHKNKKFDSDEFNEVFLENIKIHLNSDVPIAFTLSGGLDSSSIVKNSLVNNLPKNKSYSYASDTINENDERGNIKKFLEVNSIKHSFVSVKKEIDITTLEELIYFQDEPISNMSFLNQFILRKRMRRDGFKVLLVGEGADEALAGYSRLFIPYLYFTYIKNNKKIPTQLIKNISSKLGKTSKVF